MNARLLLFALALCVLAVLMRSLAFVIACTLVVAALLAPPRDTRDTRDARDTDRDMRMQYGSSAPCGA